MCKLSGARQLSLAYLHRNKAKPICPAIRPSLKFWIFDMLRNKAKPKIWKFDLQRNKANLEISNFRFAPQ